MSSNTLKMHIQIKIQTMPLLSGRKQLLNHLLYTWPYVKLGSKMTTLSHFSLETPKKGIWQTVHPDQMVQNPLFANSLAIFL